MDDNQSARLSGLFERLLAGEDLESTIASEPDLEVQQAARTLWLNHVGASDSNFLGEAVDFDVLPVFAPGQLLAGRFRIEKLLGRGGMGEVYLAFDNRMGEQVAIKTVARLVSPSAAIRERIVEEVQNARRVTHPNICRIHELFDEGDTVFFSMEYVRGDLLSDIRSKLSKSDAQRVVLQMASGLLAAHNTGVVHGDFKPANVMVSVSGQVRAVIMDFGLARALEGDGSGAGAAAMESLSLQGGSLEYMAPELLAGARPTVRSDVFAFGKVAREMLPGESIWADCTRARPQERLASLEPVLRYLQPGMSRRYWIVGGAVVVVAAGASRLLDWPSRETFISLPANARMLVNGFRSRVGEFPAVRLTRSLVLTALRQSPRLRAIDDRDSLPALRRIVPGGTLPVAGKTLQDLLNTLRASHWVDAEIAQSGGRYSLQLRVLRAGDARVLSEEVFRDVPGVNLLAQRAADWLRKMAGESKQSLAANSSAVATYTSKVPEALEKYYDAMEHYAVAEMAQARTLLAQAVQLDPEFAQAQSMLGVLSSSSGSYEDAFRAVELGMRLAGHLPDGEKAWIEVNYYNFTQDLERMVEAARRSVGHYPDEPRFCRLLANALCRAGRPEEAIPWNRKAIQLAPEEELLRADIIQNLSQAGRFTEALDEYRAALAAGMQNGWLHGDAGTAYVGLERYAEASAAYLQEPEHPAKQRDIQGVMTLQGKLQGAITRMVEQHSAPFGLIERLRADDFLCGLYYLSGQPRLAQTYLEELVNPPLYPAMARRLERGAFWAIRLGDQASLAAAHSNAVRLVERWPNPTTEAVQKHAAGLLAWRANALDQAERMLLDSLGSSFGILTLFDVADFYTSRGQSALADSYWQRFEDRRGEIIGLYFPGVLVMGWLRRAVAAEARFDRATAARYSQKILTHWSSADSGLPVYQAARRIAAAN